MRRSRTDQAVLFSAVGLGAGDHTITITWSGKNASAAATSYLVVDAIDAPSAPSLLRA